MKVRQMIASVMLFPAFSDSFKNSRLHRPLSQTTGPDHNFIPHGIMDITPENYAVGNIKKLLVSCLMGLFVFGSAVPSSMASTLGSKVDIGEAISCENIKLDHLIKVGAGGGGTVFSAVRRDFTQTVIDIENAPKVIGSSQCLILLTMA